MLDLLSALSLDALNPGTALGGGLWAEGQRRLTSASPASGEAIAQIAVSDDDHYEAVMGRAMEAKAAWAALPAPRRGEAVRLIGDDITFISTRP